MPKIKKSISVKEWKLNSERIVNFMQSSCIVCKNNIWIELNFVCRLTWIQYIWTLLTFVLSPLFVLFIDVCTVYWRLFRLMMSVQLFRFFKFKQLQFFQKSMDSNNHRGMYIPNPTCTEFHKYEWIGKMMGACFRSKEYLVCLFFVKLFNKSIFHFKYVLCKIL